MSDTVGILGFGFSGLMVLGNLLRHAPAGLTVYLIAPNHDARGLAYSTPYAEHLLNVRAANMSAWADKPDDFVQWLAAAKQPYGAQDFVPRQVYGAYLESIWLQLQERASEKNIHLKLVPSEAVAVRRHAGGLAVTTARGDAIACDQLVLAVGHGAKPMRAPLAAPVLQDPWADGALAEAARSEGPILLLGTGLTAIDMVLALRKEGYAGTILATSRRLLLPQPHRDELPAYRIAPEMFAGLARLQDWARWARAQARALPDWRMLVDGLRPHTQRIWQQWELPMQQCFLKRLYGYWNVHRHRMAPQIAVQIAEERLRGTLQLLRSAQVKPMKVALVINCAGTQLDVRQDARPLWRSLLAEGLAEVHETGLGIRADARLRAWGQAHPQLYVLGGALTGQLLESTAVPELRGQAATIGEALCRP